MQSSVISLRTYDGMTLSVRDYAPVVPTDRTLVILHGLGEYAERYRDTCQVFTVRGWRVLVPDQRGHGESQGVRTHVLTFDEYVQDVAALVEHFQLEPQRTALLGHSMGGLIAARFVQTHGDRVAALALLAPLLRSLVPVQWWKKALGRLLIRVAPRTRFRTNLKARDMTHDPVGQQLWREDPKFIRSVTAAWYFAMEEAVQAVHAEAHRVDVPVLVLQGDADCIVDPAAPEPWLQRVSSSDKTLTMLAGDAHDLLNEIDRHRIATLVADWLDAKVRPTVRRERRASVQ